MFISSINNEPLCHISTCTPKIHKNKTLQTKNLLPIQPLARKKLQLSSKQLHNSKATKNKLKKNLGFCSINPKTKGKRKRKKLIQRFITPIQRSNYTLNWVMSL